MPDPYITVMIDLAYPILDPRIRLGGDYVGG